MPIIVRAQTIGGRRFKNLARRLGRRFPEFRRRVYRRIAREILPEIERQTPERTGRLHDRLSAVSHARKAWSCEIRNSMH